MQAQLTSTMKITERLAKVRWPLHKYGAKQSHLLANTEMLALRDEADFHLSDSDDSIELVQAL